MSIRNWIRAFGLFVVFGISSWSLAQDTDLFVDNPGADGGLPNVLIILDNTANWSASAPGGTKFDLEKAALQSVFAQLPEGKYNIGMMLFSESGGGNGNPSGGYVRYAIREMDATNKTALGGLIGGLGINEDKGNAAKYALAMHEAYLYFKGQNALAGHNKVKRDEFAFNPNPKYRSPIVDACAKNYIIFISNGAPDSGENTAAGNLLQALGGRLNSDPIALNPSTRQANWTDEYARFLAANNINTYAIDVNPLTTGQGPANTALLRSVASQGKGRYYAVFNAADLELALENALNEMLAIDSVYASTALPVSVNVRGTFLNEVYMAVFRPDPNARPRWLGNMKLYQLGVNDSTGALFLADSRGEPAQSPVTGFIRSDAVSFWTESSTYWAHSPRGQPPSVSDSPDGEVVEKGGTAQVLRSDWPTRRLYTYTCTGTCTANSALSDMPFATGNGSISAGALGVAAGDRDALINWVGGMDNTSPPELPADRASTEARPSLHGDVVHSRPTVVNYNSTGNDTDIVVFYGANDGVLRAVQGGKAQADSGTELWGFVAPEFFSKLKRLRDDAPGINVPSYPDLSVSSDLRDPADNKPYFVDGSMSVLIRDVNGDRRIRAGDGDKAYLYVPMRRGGRFLYAFDVSDPAQPKFLWKRSRGDTGYGELGQTWSEAKVARINLGTAAAPVPTSVLVMGAGYDPAADDLLPAGTNTQGRGVMVINALTGDVLWQAGPSPSGATHNHTVAGMTRSIPADITIIDRDRDGFADRLYAVDTGANVWRIDIGNTNPSGWQVHKLAELGGTGNAARKFLFPADVVYGRDSVGPYDAVLIGSGDREQPFNKTIVNRFYMLKDRKKGLDGSDQATITTDALYDATANLIQDGTESERAQAQIDITNAKGWYITLRTGEKVVGSAITIGGSVFFATNQPKTSVDVDPDVCTGNLGIARAYVVSYKDARSTSEFNNIAGLDKRDRSIEITGGGLPPSPTPVIVDIDGGTYQTVCFGPTCLQPPDVVLDQRRRVWWNRCIEGEGEGDSAVGACD